MAATGEQEWHIRSLHRTSEGIVVYEMRAGGVWRIRLCDSSRCVV